MRRRRRRKEEEEEEEGEEEEAKEEAKEQNQCPRRHVATGVLDHPKRALRAEERHAVLLHGERRPRDATATNQYSLSHYPDRFSDVMCNARRKLQTELHSTDGITY
eukprot:2343198-Pyramimonas_sp.AAC.1